MDISQCLAKPRGCARNARLTPGLIYFHASGMRTMANLHSAGIDRRYSRRGHQMMSILIRHHRLGPLAPTVHFVKSGISIGFAA
jgi:hypothetical protein